MGILKVTAPIFVSGIGTGVGKTVASAVLVKALGAAYWKPIQTGPIEEHDGAEILRLVGDCKIYPEAYSFSDPISPHAAAARGGQRINLESIKLPQDCSLPLVIEGAGGLLVPINETARILDLIVHLKAQVVLVSRNYLGSINHTMLSIEVLKASGLKILGLIFNGEKNQESEDYILRASGLSLIGHLGFAERIDPEYIDSCAKKFSSKPFL